MPFLVSEAFDYNDVLWQARSLVDNFPQVSKTNPEDPTDTGVVIDDVGGAAAVGDGRVYIAALSSRVVLEEITLTCTTGGGDGVAIFSVSGGTTGAFTTANLTAGVRYVSNDLLIIIRTITNWSAVADADRIRFTLIDGAFTRNVQETPQVDFTAGPTNTIDRDDNLDWINFGYTQGGGILIADAVDAANNDFFLIDSLVTDVLTVDAAFTLAAELNDVITATPYNARAVVLAINVDFAQATRRITLNGGGGWNDHSVTENDYIRIQNAVDSGNNDYWKVEEIITVTNPRDTLIIESGASFPSDETADDIDVTVFFIPGRWGDDRFENDGSDVSMSAPPSEDGNGDFVTQWASHAPGLTGIERVYVSWASRFSNTLSYFNLGLFGADSFVSSNAHGAHPNSSTHQVFILLNRSPMQFYLSVNADAMWGFVKAGGSIDEPFYAGLISRHGSSTQLPYPLCVGGASGLINATSTNNVPSDTSNQHSAYYKPTLDTAGGGAADFPSAQTWFQRKDGVWMPMIHGIGPTAQEGRDNGDALGPTPMVDGWWTPYHSDGDSASGVTPDNPTAWAQLVRSGFGDAFEFTPIELHDNLINHYGELHGMFHISGQGDGANATENTELIGADNYVVMQNTFRSAREDYAIMRLEN